MRLGRFRLLLDLFVESPKVVYGQLLFGISGLTDETYALALQDLFRVAGVTRVNPSEPSSDVSVPGEHAVAFGQPSCRWRWPARA